jgi:hypothetical protein
MKVTRPHQADGNIQSRLPKEQTVFQTSFTTKARRMKKNVSSTRHS